MLRGHRWRRRPAQAGPRGWAWSAPARRSRPRSRPRAAAARRSLVLDRLVRAGAPDRASPCSSPGRRSRRSAPCSCWRWRPRCASTRSCCSRASTRRRPRPRSCSRPSSGSATDAPYLGPLVVALLVGPLDVLHWEQRSYVRMAYNAGNRGLATLAAAGAFAGTHALVGGSTVGWVVVVLVSAGVFFVVDEAISIVLLRLHGEGYRAALSEVIEIDVLAMPIALVGATAGHPGDRGRVVGGRARGAARGVRARAGDLPGAGAGDGDPRPGRAAQHRSRSWRPSRWSRRWRTPRRVAILCVLAVFLGIELAPSRGALVPPLVALVVIPACALLDDDRVRVGAVVVAVVATATSWWCERRPRARDRPGVRSRSRSARGSRRRSSRSSCRARSTGSSSARLSAGVAFEVLTLLAAPHRRRQGAGAGLDGAALAGAGRGRRGVAGRGRRCGRSCSWASWRWRWWAGRDGAHPRGGAAWRSEPRRRSGRRGCALPSCSSPASRWSPRSSVSRWASTPRPWRGRGPRPGSARSSWRWRRRGCANGGSHRGPDDGGSPRPSPARSCSSGSARRSARAARRGDRSRSVSRWWSSCSRRACPAVSCARSARTTDDEVRTR